MNLKDPQAKTQLMNRLHRIEGQVRGVQSMVEQERDCREVLQQLAAVRAAVVSVSQIFVQSYVSDCLLNLEDADREQREQMVTDLVALLGKGQ